MADISDVENGIASLISTALYPTGVPAYTPPAQPLSPAVPAACVVSRGWPNGEQLDKDLAAGIVTVTVFQKPGLHPMPMTQENWVESATTAPTITASVNGSQVVFGGTAGSNQVVTVITGGIGLQEAFSYRLLATDTPATVATAIAALIPKATASGTALSLPTSLISAVVVADGTVSTVVSRQEQQVIVTVWAPTPSLRDAAAAAIVPPLLSAYRMTMPDGTQATMRRVNDMVNDVPSQANAWRRDITFAAQYITIFSKPGPRITVISGNITLGGDVLTYFGPLTVPAQIYQNADGSVLLDEAGNILGVPS